MASDDLETRAPSRPEPEGDAPDVDDEAESLSEEDLRGIAAIRRRLDLEFGAPPGEPSSPVAEPRREWRLRAAPARRTPRTAIAGLVLLAGAFVGFITAVVTFVMLESRSPSAAGGAPPTSAGGAAPAAASRAPSPPAATESGTVEDAAPIAAPELPPRTPRMPPRTPAAAPELPRRTPPPRDLQGALGQWIDATRRRDIDGQMALYPERVDVFYTWRNVSRAAVRGEKQRVFGDATVLDISTGPAEITARPDGRTAVTRFHNRYVIEGPRVRRRGEVVQELRWVRTGDGWKIIAERDAEILP